MTKIDCSIIFPLYNESENIKYSYNKINEIMNKTNLTYEIIYVNDGSTDNSEDLIKTLCEKDNKVRLITFSRNFGQQSASMAGLQHCKGKCAINLDIDLEEDPNVIYDMIKAWQDGYDIVTIKRKKRKDGIFKRFFAWSYFKILKFLGVKNIDNLAEFRLLDRKTIEEIKKASENNVFLKNQINFIGFKQITLEANRTKREHGKSSYNFKKLSNIAFKSIVSSTNRPLYFSFSFSIIFFLLSIISLITLITLSCCKVAFHMSFWLIPISLICTTTILLVLGFMGMYLAFTYDEVRNRPIYIIKERINFED